MSIIFQKKARGVIQFLTSDAFTGKEISMMKENYNFRSWYNICSPKSNAEVLTSTILTKNPILVVLRTTRHWTFSLDLHRTCCAYKVVFSHSSLDGEWSPVL